MFQKNQNTTKQEVAKVLFAKLELAMGLFLATPYLGSAIQHPSDQLTLCSGQSELQRMTDNSNVAAGAQSGCFVSAIVIVVK
eukprot:2199975-Rhodomonas_salina.1